MFTISIKVIVLKKLMTLKNYSQLPLNNCNETVSENIQKLKNNQIIDNNFQLNK